MQKLFTHEATILNRSGFTLIEVLLSVVLISVISGIGIPLYQSFQVRNDLTISSNTITETLRRAQVLSRGSSGDSSWGVFIESGNIVLFVGTSYATRDANFDEKFSLPTSITPSGFQEIVFSKFSGFPQTFGLLTLTSSTNEIRTISINEKGTIIY